MEMDFSGLEMYWQQFLDWFLEIPLYGQILIIAGAIAIVVLACIGVYYLLKGVAYLIYYIFKGVGYLFYYIFKGIYLLFEGLYYLISGKEKPKKQGEPPKVEEEAPVIEKQVVLVPRQEPVVASFCSQCGAKFSETMVHQLATKGKAYCVHCGEGLTANPIEVVI